MNQQEMQQGLLVEKWNRTNLILFWSTLLLGLFQLYLLEGTGSMNGYECKRMLMQGVSGVFTFRIILLVVYVYLILIPLNRIKQIEAIATNWEGTEVLGRPLLKASRNIAVIVLLLLLVEIIFLFIGIEAGSKIDSNDPSLLPYLL